MQVCAAKLLQEQYDREGSKMTAHAFNPGYTLTPVFEKLQLDGWWSDPFVYLLKLWTALALPIEAGAATGVIVVTKDLGKGAGGGYWDRGMRNWGTVCTHL